MDPGDGSQHWGRRGQDMIVIVMEKPSVARDIARVLGCRERGRATRPQRSTPSLKRWGIW